MHDHDELIKDAFRGLASAAGPHVRPAGAGAVRATVRQHRTVRGLALGLLAVLVAAVPVTAHALTPHGAQSPPVGSAADPTTATIGPSGATTASPPATASPVPPATASAGSGGRFATAVISVSGVVRNAGTNAGLGGALVALRDSAGHMYKVNTDSTGQFVFRSTAQNPIAPGTLAIGVAMNGFQNQVQDNIKGPAGQAVVNLVLTLQPVTAGTSVTGKP